MDLSPLLALIPAKDLIYLPAIVGGFSAFAMALPAPKAGAKGAYPLVYKAVNFVALNLLHAKNAAAVEGICPRVGSPPVAK